MVIESVACTRAVTGGSNRSAATSKNTAAPTASATRPPPRMRGMTREFMLIPAIRMDRSDVLVAGAGPTGLVLALWLTRAGRRVRIVDKLAAPGTTSRALGVQARTLELYRQLGLADRVVERGRRVIAANMWVAGRHVARAVLGDMGAGISPFPYLLIYPQDEHERLLIAALEHLGVSVERETELKGFEETADGVRARLVRADGSTASCGASFIAGCDGAHSAVREQLAIGFQGGTYEHLFYVADVDGAGPATNGELHVALDSADFLAVFPLKDAGRARMDEDRRPSRQLVLHLPRPPSCGRTIPQRPRVSRRRRRAHPQPGRRAGDEHRHRRRGQPGVEARRRSPRRRRSGHARHVSSRADRLRAAPGRDHRSRVHGRDQRDRACPNAAAVRGAAAVPGAVRVDDSTAAGVPHRLANGDRISAQLAQR